MAGPVKRAIVDAGEGPRPVYVCPSSFWKLMLQIMPLFWQSLSPKQLRFPLFSFLFLNARTQSSKVELYSSSILHKKQKKTTRIYFIQKLKTLQYAITKNEVIHYTIL